MTPEDAYNEWLLLFGYRKVTINEVVNKRAAFFSKLPSATLDIYVHRLWESNPDFRYQLKQRHEIKENK